MRQEPEQQQEKGYCPWISTASPSHTGARENCHHPTSTQNCKQNIKQMSTFDPVEQSWGVFSHHVLPPWNLTGHSGFLLFKEGVKPMWEDDANKNGGNGLASFSSLGKGGLCIVKGCKAPGRRVCSPVAPFPAGGNLGNIFGTRPSHAAIPRQELCNEASRAAGRGWKDGGGGRHSANPSSLGNREARRRGQDAGDPDGPESRPRKLQGRGGEERVGPVPSPRQGPPPRAPRDSTWGREPRGVGGRAGTAAPAPPTPLRPRGRGGVGGTADSPGRPRPGSPGSHFRLEHRGFQRRRAPTPAGRLALSGCDAAVRVRRSLSGSPEPPGPPAPPGRPRAAQRARPGLRRGNPGSPGGTRSPGAGSQINLWSRSPLRSAAGDVRTIISVRALPGSSGHSP
uniref:collagen alpha-1(I) chain-like n=1 Tax=Panthera onca TaxID=9690 RepID=UPI002952EB35|nr:collagen alpha-1(I) chain-like [Panthera onca]